MEDESGLCADEAARSFTTVMFGLSLMFFRAATWVYIEFASFCRNVGNCGELLGLLDC